jgi:hypothetical protein
MNTTDLLVLGLLVLVANLTLSALFVPPKARPSVAEPLLRLWKLLALAFAQVMAWAVVIDQGGAADSFADAFLRAAGCFALVSGVQGAPVFAAPWNQFAGLIALNGLLFVPVTLLPALFPAAAPRGPEGREAAQNPAPPTPPAVPSAAPVEPGTGVPPETRPAAVQAPSAAETPSGTPSGPPAVAAAPAPVETAVTAASSPLVAESGKRPLAAPLAPAPMPPPPAHAPLQSPVDGEAEYAALMRPPGPTPPPIRFGNRP